MPAKPKFKRHRTPTKPERRLIHDFKKADCQIYETPPYDQPLSKQRIEVEMMPRAHKDITNMEHWDYMNSLEVLIGVVGSMYKAGVDVCTETFEKGIIKSHDWIEKEAML